MENQIVKNIRDIVDICEEYSSNYTNCCFLGKKANMDNNLKDKEVMDCILEYVHGVFLQYINPYSECNILCRDYILNSNNTDSYVYFIRNKDSGLTKIGKTCNLKRRLSQLKGYALQCGVKPQKLSYIAIIHCCGSNTKMEKYAHSYFDSKRVMGEWFNISDKQISDFLSDCCEYGVFMIDSAISSHKIQVGVSSASNDDVYDLTRDTIFDVKTSLPLEGKAIDSCDAILRECRYIEKVLGLFNTINQTYTGLTVNVRDNKGYHKETANYSDKVKHFLLSEIFTRLYKQIK